jgi:hypothetical protein
MALTKTEKVSGFGVCSQKQLDELIEEEGTLAPMDKDSVATAIADAGEDAKILAEMMKEIFEENNKKLKK